MASPFLEQLRRYFECEYVVPVGSGTSGLSLALRSIKVRDRVVLLPAITCPNVPVAVLAAGGVPVAVDVSADDATIDPQAVSRALDHDVAAIIAVDVFGYPARIAELRRLADVVGCPIVEDACQAYGGRQDGVRLGVRSEIGVVSFGYSKNVWLGAGGLLLTDDEQVAREVREMQNAPDYRLLSRIRSRMTLKVGLTHPERLPALVQRMGLLRYAFPSRQARLLPGAWRVFIDELPDTKVNLRRVAEAVAAIPGVEPFAYEEDDWLPWRYSVCVPDADASARFESAMTAAGVELTHLYPTLTEPFVDPGRQDCPVARRLSESIINIRHRARAAETRSLAEQLEALVLAWPGTDGA